MTKKKPDALNGALSQRIAAYKPDNHMHAGRAANLGRDWTQEMAADFPGLRISTAVEGETVHLTAKAPKNKTFTASFDWTQSTPVSDGITEE